MSAPDWRTSGSGTRIRAALWLMDVVGVGNSFTKAELRTAFPGVEQIDRRLRDLRDDGWVIATNREDRSLDPDELRFVSMGGPVWERGYRRPGAPAASRKMRLAVFAADRHTCVVCGVIGGDTFPDDPLRVARLTCQRLSGDGGSLRLRARATAASPEATAASRRRTSWPPRARSATRSWMLSRRGARARRAHPPPRRPCLGTARAAARRGAGGRLRRDCRPGRSLICATCCASASASA